MFDIDRTFSQRSEKTGLMEWYFNAREGIFGPYATKQIASNELAMFIERRILADDDGGRGAVKTDKLSILPIEHTSEPKVFDYAKRKKGIDEL